MAVSATPVPPGHDRADGAAVIVEPAFVGRERELAALTRALAGPPVVLVVEGEAGIGKSRLVRELLATPAGGRYRCLTVSCPPFREPFTLGPVVDAIRQAVGRVSSLRLSRLAGALRALFPEWADELPPSPEPLEDVRASRHRVFRALVEVLDRLNVGLVVLEDAHWADEATIEFLLFVSTQPARSISLVVTYRPEEIPAGSLLPRLVSRAPAGTTLTRVSLTGLDAEHTRELVSAMLGAEPVSRVFAELLCQRAGGIPFVVEQLVRLMYDRADLVHQDGQWKRHELHSIEVPPTIRDAILERVSRLPHQVGEILRAAAVLGDPVDKTTLLAVANVPDGEDGVTGAIDSGLLVADRDTLALRHVLAATTIYESIPAGRRRDLHLRAGRALEPIPGQPPDRLAHHFREAGQMSTWYPYAERAAALALAASDHSTAVPLLRGLLAHADRLDLSVIGLVDKISFGTVRADTHWTELIPALRSVLCSFPRGPGPEAIAWFQLGRLLILADRFEEGRAEMRLVIPHLRDDPATAARAMLGLAIPGDPTTPAAEHLRWSRRAAALPPPDDPTARLALQINLAVTLLVLGREEGWAMAAALPDPASSTRDRHHLGYLRLALGDQAMRRGRYPEAISNLDRAVELTDVQRDPGVVDSVAITRCHVDWFIGNWTGLADRARRIDTDRSLDHLRREASLVIGLLHIAAGAYERAEGHLRVGLEVWRGDQDPIEVAAALARSRLDRCQVDEALAVTDDATAMIRAKGVWLWATELAPIRVEALLAAGRVNEATEITTRFGRGIRGTNAPAGRAALGLCRALLVEHRGDHADAARRYARVAGAWRDMPRPYDALLAEERQARCLLAVRREREGLDLLARVLDGLTALGAVAAADRVARQLGEHGVRVRPSRRGRRGYGGEISPREIEVLRLLVTGMTNREIGQALSRSPKTVAAQLNSAMRKLGVASRTALAVSVLDTGLVAAPEGSGSVID